MPYYERSSGTDAFKSSCNQSGEPLFHTAPAHIQSYVMTLNTWRQLQDLKSAFYDAVYFNVLKTGW